MTSHKLSACHYLKLNQPTLVEVVHHPETGYNLVAKTAIKKGNPVVIYYGKIIKDQNILLEQCLNDPDVYRTDIAPYIRGNQKHSIDASHLVITPHTNRNLMGVYVNDIQPLKSLEPYDIRDYLKSQSRCNLVVASDTRDYPVYLANRAIKAGEPLSVHYGLAYWLLQLGVCPSNIREIIDAFV